LEDRGIGKKAWGSRGLWDARRRQWISASVLAFPVRHPEHPDLPLWLVVARRKGSTPCYLLTSEPVETETEAWKVLLAYARRWQIELRWKTWKSELGMQSPRVWDGETRLKLLGLATLAYAFLLHLLSAPFQLVRRWLLRSGAHRSGRRLRATRLARLRLAYPPGVSRRARPVLAVSYPLPASVAGQQFPCRQRAQAGWECADSCTCCITCRTL
jgi:Transposase DDE domain